MIACDGTRFNEGVFKIRIAGGAKKTVYGFWSGLLGYYRSESEGNHGYAITHLPTGCCVLWVKRAREARKFISQAQHLDWNFDTPDSPKVQANIFPCHVISSRLGSRHATSYQAKYKKINGQGGSKVQVE